MPYILHAEIPSSEVESLRKEISKTKKAVSIKVLKTNYSPIIPGAIRAESWHDVAVELVAMGTAGISALAVILKNYWLSKKKKIRFVDIKTGRLIEYDGADPDLESKLLEIVNSSKE